MEDINTNNIKRNSNDFSFVDTLGSFINNYEFEKGYKDYQKQLSSKYSYIWHTLSAIGENYAEAIYENVLNYLDNASNVDLCKVKALQSMLKIIGTKYDIIDVFQKLPLEIANLIDILSVNKSYLLKSNIFKKTFIDQLYESGCIVSSSVSSSLSSELDSPDKVADDSEISSYMSDGKYYCDKIVLDDDKYFEFLQTVYTKTLNDFVYMQYADAENNIPHEYQYIYEYIKDVLRGEQADVSNESMNEYDLQIQKLKIQYNISKSFDQQAIVDEIENGNDSFDNYNIYEQEVLSYEIRHREATYSYAKKYNDNDEKFFGYNLTRYSYYREKKVKEYFNFIENTYSNLLIENNIIRSLNDENITIQQYENDPNYFVINQNDKKYLLEYDADNKRLQIQTNYILEIAKLLATQTIQISELREQLKIQMQKNYMKGTFLLMSYMINEFLKYNIADKYGNLFYTEDTNVALNTILTSSIATGENVNLIEYYDNTEYYNITTENDLSAKNGSDVNEKFWDNFNNKIGVNTNDIPLDEIENFYLNQLNIKRNNVDNVVQFLSVIYEYGANKTYMYDNETTDWMQHGDFVCKIHDGRWIGDPYYVMQRIRDNIMSANMIYDDIMKYVNAGYEIPLSSVDQQIEDLKTWIEEVFYYNEISSANEELKQNLFKEFDDNYDSIESISKEFVSVSADYEKLKANEEYAPYYFTEYKEYYEYIGHEVSNCYFYDKLNNFYLSCTSDDGFSWKNLSVLSILEEEYEKYIGISSDLYEKLFALSVWPAGTMSKASSTDTQYWPYYSPEFDNEITAVTQALKTHLMSQVEVNKKEALQHLQNHYDKLIGLKNDLNLVVQNCDEAIAKYEAMKAGVEATTMTNMYRNVYESFNCFEGPVIEYKNPHFIDGDKSLGVEYDEVEVVDHYLQYEYTYQSNAITDNDTISEKLQKLEIRSQMPSKGNLVQVWALNESDESPDGGIHFSKRVAHNYDYTIKYDEDWSEKFYEYYFSYDYSYGEKKQMGYFETDLKQPYGGAYSQSTASDILAKLEDAVVKLDSQINLINSELECLGFDPLDVLDPDIDSVKDDAHMTYDELIGRIDALDDYIHAAGEKSGWWALADRTDDPHDENLYQYRDRIDRIAQITLSAPIAYNIQHINGRFFDCDNTVNNLLAENKKYFINYVNSEIRLDHKICSIIQYMNARDSESKAKVLKEVEDISSAYFELILDKFDPIASALNRYEVSSINDDYSYNLATISYKSDISAANFTYESAHDYLDYLLYGAYIVNYLETIPPHFPYTTLNGTLNWLKNDPQSNAYQLFEKSADSAIKIKVPTLSAYLFSCMLLDIASSKFLHESLSSDEQITKLMLDVIEYLENDEIYISSQIPIYNTNKEIYLKYNGTEIGYDPFYNHKNVTYSSYQIHPYLYNFVKKTNIVYPLANNFFISFGKEYEMDLYAKGIDDIVGRYGNVINTWKSQLFDFTSYQSKYEKETRNSLALSSLNAVQFYTGAFFPPALDAFLSDPDSFIQDVRDNVETSYYYHLNLTNAELDKIAQQLKEYEPAIRELVQRKTDAAFSPSLSTEFDIYKFGLDANGNSLILYKSYTHLYQLHNDEISYTPSYNEKKNTPGELWMRIKDHPIAFPAFDLRQEFRNISQYNVDKIENFKGQQINSYIEAINSHFMTISDKTLKLLTLDLVGKHSRSSHKQNLRCFFDMEFDPTKRSLLLSLSYCTGTNSKTYSSKMQSNDLFTYANSSIVIGNLTEEYDYDNNTHVYNFTKDKHVSNSIVTNIDNISNPGMLYKIGNMLKTTNKLSNVKYDFVGFAKNANYAFAVFVQKYINTNSFLTMFNKKNSRIKKNPSLKVHCAYYKYGTVIGSNTVSVNDLKYDIFTTERAEDIENQTSKYDNLKELYKYANTLALAYDNKNITLGFISQRIQDHMYEDNTQVVNFVEYTAMVDKKIDLSAYGQNLSYPRDTALIQTDDAQHINIYNSFDSFTQNLVNVNFSVSNSKLRHIGNKYFNLNSDLGFIPQFADRPGLSRYYNNRALKNLSSYNIELLGPENSDVKYTPVISQTDIEESYGRIVEDYKSEVKFMKYSSQLTFLEGQHQVTAEYLLSDIMSLSTYASMQESNELFSYKYMLTNTKYEAFPIVYGALSAQYPLSNAYLSSEEYDLLSGQEIIGPNNVSYQNNNMTNHINNISSIQTEVIYNATTKLPYSIRLSCNIRQAVYDKVQLIPDQQFGLLVYRINSLNSYKYYHMIENSRSDHASQRMTEDQNYRIDFNSISSMSQLSAYEIDGKKPFANYSGLSAPNQMSALLEFKYSEETNVDREFPFLEENRVNDEEIITLENKDQYIYFIALDNYDTLKITPFYIDRYYPSTTGIGTYKKLKINTNLPSYKDFYNKAMQIEVTYNMEKHDNALNQFEIVLYFNYKNFTNPSYVDFKKTYPPVGAVCSQSSTSLNNTYLVLKPGENGRLDMRVDYLFYDKIDPRDIAQSIVGHKTEIMKSYYIMNVSDSKPKFIISKNPFKEEDVQEDTDVYELSEDAKDNTSFRYVRLAILSNKGKGGSGKGSAKYVSLSELQFSTKYGELFVWPEQTEELPNQGIENVVGYTPIRLTDGNTKTKFLGTTRGTAEGKPIAFPVKIGFDLKSQCLDIKKYCKWKWFNPDNAKTHYGYLPSEFYLEFSNDKNTWFRTETIRDYTLTIENERQAYEGNIEFIQ